MDKKSYDFVNFTLPLSALLRGNTSKDDVGKLVNIWKNSETEYGKLVVKNTIKSSDIRELIDKGLIKGNYIVSSLMPEQVVELTTEGKEILKHYLLKEQSAFDKAAEAKPIIKTASTKQSKGFNLKRHREENGD